MLTDDQTEAELGARPTDRGQGVQVLVRMLFQWSRERVDRQGIEGWVTVLKVCWK